VDEFILDEDLASESHIFKLFEDSEDKVAIGLLNLRWCAMIGFPICESADQSLWAKRLEVRFQKRLACLVPINVFSINFILPPSLNIITYCFFHIS